VNSSGKREVKNDHIRTTEHRRADRFVIADTDLASASRNEPSRSSARFLLCQ
jgi:hypothetical protein